MYRSIKKSISVNELNYIFQLNNIQEEKRSYLIPELFDNPKAEKIYLLKEDIRTSKDLEDRVRDVIDQQDCIFAITNAFSVDDDLAIPLELREILFSNIKLAFFVGAGVSKLLKIPLWEELADNAINYLKENNYINHTESSRLKNEKYTAKQVMSIFHQIVRDKNAFKKFFEDHLCGAENKEGNPYELPFSNRESSC